MANDENPAFETAKVIIRYVVGVILSEPKLQLLGVFEPFPQRPVGLVRVTAHNIGAGARGGGRGRDCEAITTTTVLSSLLLLSLFSHRLEIGVRGAAHLPLLQLALLQVCYGPGA
jgi:hypothetical protein